jgi:hypothetical protein
MKQFIDKFSDKEKFCRFYSLNFLIAEEIVISKDISFKKMEKKAKCDLYSNNDFTTVVYYKDMSQSLIQNLSNSKKI